MLKTAAQVLEQRREIRRWGLGNGRGLGWLSEGFDSGKSGGRWHGMLKLAEGGEEFPAALYVACTGASELASCLSLCCRLGFPFSASTDPAEPLG